MSQSALLTIGAAAMSLLAAAGITRAAVHAWPGPQGGSWESIERLPDWSGAWALSGSSFQKQFLASSGPDGNPNVPPLTAKWAAFRDANGAANHGQGPPGGVNTNSLHCLPDGMPGMMAAPFSFEFLFTPGRVTVISEDGEVRRIWTDGRAHPPDPDPTFAGNSIGHWEGTTLVVDTIGMTPQAEVMVGLHDTAKTHVVERIFKKSSHTLRIDTVVIDPALFTKPYRYTRTYDLNPHGMTEYVCEQNNRDQNGKINLTPPPN